MSDELSKETRIFFKEARDAIELAIDADEIRKFKLELITQAGKLDFYEAETRIYLAEIQLRKAETEKLAMQLSQLETRFNMFMLENRNEGM